MGKYLDSTGLSYLWGKIKALIPSAVATATPTTATISGVSSSSVTTVQYGCVVTVDVSITLTATITNQTQLCASLPKPLTAVRTVADQFETTYKRPLRFILGTSGMLDIRLGEAGTYYHHFTYITNEGITTLTDGDLTSF